MSIALTGRGMKTLKLLLFGETGPLEMPDRVRATIERQ